MATITKKELIDRIAEATDQKRVLIKRVVQRFLDEIVEELGRGNRLEFRDFGVFETKRRRARRAQNPRTLEPVKVPEKRTVKFKVGRLMREKLEAPEVPPHGGAPGPTHGPTHGSATLDGSPQSSTPAGIAAEASDPNGTGGA